MTEADQLRNALLRIARAPVDGFAIQDRVTRETVRAGEHTRFIPEEQFIAVQKIAIDALRAMTLRERAPPS